ncbi:MAG TPA: hypothetical protein VHH73_06640 [Verrucomicrobiae bacterium]|nr:hypothetical protein [Verrucomicrobiae bacterium]
MDSQQARHILRLYRPDGPDQDDPEMLAALELAARDPELKAWLDQEMARQAVLRAKFREIVPPAGLKASILKQRPIAQKVISFPALAALAASLALMAGLAVFWFSGGQSNHFSLYRDRMVSNALRNYRMNLVTRDLGQIRDYLRKNSAHGDYALTPQLAKLPGEGCAVLHWHGREVSMICLDAGAGKPDDLYLFVIDRGDVRSAPRDSAPNFAKVNKLMTASWSVGGKVYLLAGKGDEAALRRFF